MSSSLRQPEEKTASEIITISPNQIRQEIQTALDLFAALPSQTSYLIMILELLKVMHAEYPSSMATLLVELLHTKSAGVSLDDAIMNHGDAAIQYAYFEFLSKLKKMPIADDVLLSIHTTYVRPRVAPSHVINFYTQLADTKDTANKLLTLILKNDNQLLDAVLVLNPLDNYSNYLAYFNMLEYFDKLGADPRLIRGLFSGYPSPNSLAQDGLIQLSTQCCDLYRKICIRALRNNLDTTHLYLAVKSELAKEIIAQNDAALLQEALDPFTNLGALFWRRRGVLAPSVRRGTLKKLKRALDKLSVQPAATTPPSIVQPLDSQEARAESKDVPESKHERLALLIIDEKKLINHADNIIRRTGDIYLKGTNNYNMMRLLFAVRLKIRYGNETDCKKLLRLFEFPVLGTALHDSIRQDGDSASIATYYFILEHFRANGVSAEEIFKSMRTSYCRTPILAMEFYQKFLDANDNIAALLENLSQCHPYMTLAYAVDQIDPATRGGAFVYERYHKFINDMFKLPVSAETIFKQLPIIGKELMVTLPSQDSNFSVTYNFKLLRAKVLVKWLTTESPTPAELAGMLNFKEDVCNYILAKKEISEKMALLQKAVNPTTELGKFFWTPRALTPPSLKKGTLLLLNQELIKLKRTHAPASAPLASSSHYSFHRNVPSAGSPSVESKQDEEQHVNLSL